MPLSRVAIAAAFFVIGALILVPLLSGSSSPSRAVGDNTPAPTAAVSASASGGARPTARPGTHRPTHRSSPTTTRKGTPPMPSVSPAPLTATIGKVRCPGRTVQVSVVNKGRQTEDYTVTTDGSVSVADRIPPGGTRRSAVNVREDHTTTIAVTWHNIPVKSRDRHANCAHASTHHKALPRTGPDRGELYARVATGIAVLLTGFIVVWYGRQWPRRRDRMFDER